MIVLSLFDGISCGQVALERVGIDCLYFASEIDKYAIQVTQKNYPNTVQLGCVTKIKGKNLPQIDLLMGGSPCQGFSFAGKQLNFNDPRSALFFEFVRLKELLEPKWWLLENVKMKKEYQDVITDFMGVEPVKINSALVSAQNRPRLYWANFNITQPEDENILLKDICIDGANFFLNDTYKNYPKYREGKSQTIRASRSGFKVSKDSVNYRKIDIIETERLQTLPDDYTKGISKTRRHFCIGNGWTVDVIAHIFKGLKKEAV